MAYSLERHVVATNKIYRMKGAVVTGFQRGSKQLGFPTANLDPAAFKDVLADVPRGVYCGWASIDNQGPYKAVLSLGNNPQYGNDEDTVEAYIVHKFEKDFYGAEMRLLICGYLRPMWKFESGLEELIAHISADVTAGDNALNETFWNFKDDQLFEVLGKLEAELSKSNARVCKHMNEDHALSLLAYAHHYTPHADAVSATLTKCATNGFVMDLRLRNGTTLTDVFVAYPRLLTSVGDIRKMAVEMHNTAFAHLGFVYKVAQGYYLVGLRHVADKFPGGLGGMAGVVAVTSLLAVGGLAYYRRSTL